MWIWNYDLFFYYVVQAQSFRNSNYCEVQVGTVIDSYKHCVNNLTSKQQLFNHDFKTVANDKICKSENMMHQELLA